jgi:hypothetical protein
MDEDSKDNANPTILQLSDLPSRRQDEPRQKRDTAHAMLFEDLIPSYPDPFQEGFSSPTSSEEDVNIDGNNAIEEIDEQELYGTPNRSRAVPIVNISDSQFQIS